MKCLKSVKYSPIKDWISCRNLREDHCTIKVIWPVLAISPNGQVTHCMVDPVEGTSKSVFVFVSCKNSLDSLPLLIYWVCRLRLQVAVVLPGRRSHQLADILLLDLSPRSKPLPKYRTMYPGPRFPFSASGSRGITGGIPRRLRSIPYLNFYIAHPDTNVLTSSGTQHGKTKTSHICAEIDLLS